MHRKMRRKLASYYVITKDAAKSPKEFKSIMQIAADNMLDRMKELLYQEIKQCSCKAIKERLTKIPKELEEKGGYLFRVTLEITKTIYP